MIVKVQISLKDMTDEEISRLRSSCVQELANRMIKRYNDRYLPIVPTETIRLYMGLGADRVSAIKSYRELCSLSCDIGLTGAKTILDYVCYEEKSNDHQG